MNVCMCVCTYASMSTRMCMYVCLYVFARGHAAFSDARRRTSQVCGIWLAVKRLASEVCPHCHILTYVVILYYTILYYPILYYIILYYTRLYYTILYAMSCLFAGLALVALRGLTTETVTALWLWTHAPCRSYRHRQSQRIFKEIFNDHENSLFGDM